jgi:two-component system phosphate regulon sensor histidine kinase PhoR
MIHVSIVRARNKLLVSVRDTGVGIPQIDLSRVFTKFYQASNVSRSGSKGTGLGLALVKAFVEGHGGRVFATSTVGAGSTFTVELPIPETLQTPIRGVDVSATPSVLHG